tara:strand:+ start:334 stop:909 length:576 start_codon:yes stop_codon:yes gene_type:complete
MKIKKGGKVIKLTESDLQRIVKRVLNEDAPHATTVDVENLKFKVFVNRKDITGSVSKPIVKKTGEGEEKRTRMEKEKNRGKGYFYMEIETTKDNVFEDGDVIGVQITGGKIGGDRSMRGEDEGKRDFGDGVIYFTKIESAFRDNSNYKSFHLSLTDTNLEIEEGQVPDLVVKVILNGRDRRRNDYNVSDVR